MLSNVITTSASLNTAYIQALESLWPIMRNIREAGANTLIENDLERLSPQLEAWDRSVRNNHPACGFNSKSMLIQNIALLKHYFSSRTIIVSSALLLPQFNTGLEDQDEKSVIFSRCRADAKERFGLNANIITWEGYKEKTPQGHSGVEMLLRLNFGRKNANQDGSLFDLMSIQNFAPNKNAIADRMTVPFQTIDYRIMAEMAKLGILDEFCDLFAKLISLTTHDYVHSGITQITSPDRNGAAIRLYSKMAGDETHALGTNKMNFMELVNNKPSGIVERLTYLTQKIHSLLQEFEKSGASEMKLHLTNLVKYHLSNFVKRELLQEDDFHEKIESLLREAKVETKTCQILTKGNTNPEAMLNSDGNSINIDDDEPLEEIPVTQLSLMMYRAINSDFRSSPVEVRNLASNFASRELGNAA